MALRSGPRGSSLGRSFCSTCCGRTYSSGAGVGVRGGARPASRHSRFRRILLEGFQDGGAAARTVSPVDRLRVGVDLLRLAPESLDVGGDLEGAFERPLVAICRGMISKRGQYRFEDLFAENFVLLRLKRRLCRLPPPTTRFLACLSGFPNRARSGYALSFTSQSQS
jgi:hypothetical protein